MDLGSTDAFHCLSESGDRAISCNGKEKGVVEKGEEGGKSQFKGWCIGLSSARSRYQEGTYNDFISRMMCVKNGEGSRRGWESCQTVKERGKEG